MVTFLVTLDGSPLGEKVLEPIHSLAGRVLARVCLLQVVPPAHGMARHMQGQSEQNYGAIVYPLERPVRLVETVTQEAERQEAEARDYLASMAQRLPGITVEPLVRCSADTAGEIVQAAQECGADLIAMGTHGHTGLAEMVLGSVAQSVMKRSTVPVLMVRAIE
jgi:nucleotide-binding universal stress UspA family protein